MILLWLGARPERGVEAGQGAVSYSKEGHEDLSFWTHRRGLEELDFEGEVGFGDLARTLLRRRTNAALMIDLRDRFTFRTADPRLLDTPDLVRARITATGIEWGNRPARYAGGVNRVIAVPVVLENGSTEAIDVLARLTGPGVKVNIAPKQSAAILLRFRKDSAGAMTIPLDIQASGKTAATPITFDVRPLERMQVRLLDENGRPAAARIYLTGWDGLSYVPKGSVPRIAAMSAEYFFHAGGAFAIDLPVGPTRIEAARGPEYELVSTLYDLEAGKPAEITLRLHRWSNASAKGWYSADSHIHANYTANHHQVMTPEDMHLMAAGEDLNIPNLLVANSSGEFLHDRQYFEAKPNAVSTPRQILYWNEEFRNGGLYGHMSFFRLRSLIEPFFTGFRKTKQADDYPPNYTAAKQAKEQGAATLYVHPGMSAGLDQLDWGASAKELPVDAALGVIDAMDVLSNNDEAAGMELWYRLLNCGLRIGISAGSDSFSNVTDHYVPGGHRVYARTTGALQYSEWVDSYIAGHTFATNGPMIELTVDGKEPGARIELAQPGTVKITARVTTNVPIDRIDVMSNGVAILSKRGIARGEVTLTGEAHLDRSAWIAARALGQRHRLVLNDTGVFAHTSPIYVLVGGKRIAHRDDARFFQEWIRRLEAMLHRRGQFSTPERKQEVLALFERASKVYREIETAAP